MTLFGLRANQETLPRRALCNHHADLPRGRRRRFPRRPLRSPRPGREPSSLRRFAPPRALGAVCGAGRETREAEARGERPGEGERRHPEKGELGQDRPASNAETNSRNGGGGVPSGSSRRRETADLLFQCQRPVIPPSLGKHGPLTLYASSPKPWGCLTCRRKRGTQAPTPMGTEEG